METIRKAGCFLDSAGNLFGTTNAGGNRSTFRSTVSGDGTIFEVAQGSNSITALADFDTTASGAGPVGKVP